MINKPGPGSLSARVNTAATSEFGIALGSLDDDSRGSARVPHLVASKAPWVSITDDLPQYDEGFPYPRLPPEGRSDWRQHLHPRRRCRWRLRLRRPPDRTDRHAHPDRRELPPAPLSRQSALPLSDANMWQAGPGGAICAHPSIGPRRGFGNLISWNERQNREDAKARRKGRGDRGMRGRGRTISYQGGESVDPRCAFRATGNGAVPEPAKPAPISARFRAFLFGTEAEVVSRPCRYTNHGNLKLSVVAESGAVGVSRFAMPTQRVQSDGPPNCSSPLIRTSAARCAHTRARARRSLARRTSRCRSRPGCAGQP
jgi:hypothetical protein